MDSVRSRTLRGPLQVASGAYPIHRLSIDNGMLPINIFDRILAGTEPVLPTDSADDEDDFVYRMLLLALQTAYHATVRIDTTFGCRKSRSTRTVQATEMAASATRSRFNAGAPALSR
jgi:hypothetical protein